MLRFFTILVTAFWITVIAIVAVQNATPVSIQLLGLRSVALPFGLVLAFCAAGGMVVTATLLQLQSTIGRISNPEGLRVKRTR